MNDDPFVEVKRQYNYRNKNNVKKLARSPSIGDRFERNIMWVGSVIDFEKYETGHLSNTAKYGKSYSLWVLNFIAVHKALENYNELTIYPYDWSIFNFDT